MPYSLDDLYLKASTNTSPLGIVRKRNLYFFFLYLNIYHGKLFASRGQGHEIAFSCAVAVNGLESLDRLSAIKSRIHTGVYIYIYIMGFFLVMYMLNKIYVK